MFKLILWMYSGWGLQKNWKYYQQMVLQIKNLCCKLSERPLMWNKKRSMKKGVLENFTKFTGKHLCQSLFLNKVADLRTATLLKERLLAQVFSCKFCEIFKNTFFTEHLWTTSSGSPEISFPLNLSMRSLWHNLPKPWEISKKTPWISRRSLKDL